MTAVPLTDIEPLRPVLSVRPLALFSDIDGTLSPIVDDPEEAQVTPRCRELMSELIRRGVRVALITGRELQIAQSMVRIEEASYAASHGSEFLVEGMSGFEAGGGDHYALLDQLDRTGHELTDVGVTIEVKRQGIAFHYRQAPDEIVARSRIEGLIRSVPAAGALRRIEGRKVIELRPDIDASKGTATLELAGRLGVKGVICIGDDRTDVDMFDAVHALGMRGLKVCAIAVMSTEVHPEVLAAADYSVDGVPGVEWFLAELTEVVTQTTE